MRDPLEYLALLLVIVSYYAFFMGLHYSNMFSSLPFLILRVILTAGIVLLTVAVILAYFGIRKVNSRYGNTQDIVMLIVIFGIFALCYLSLLAVS